MPREKATNMAVKDVLVVVTATVVAAVMAVPVLVITDQDNDKKNDRDARSFFLLKTCQVWNCRQAGSSSTQE
jgi:hypothetical protein